MNEQGKSEPGVFTIQRSWVRENPNPTLDLDERAIEVEFKLTAEELYFCIVGLQGCGNDLKRSNLESLQRRALLYHRLANKLDQKYVLAMEGAAFKGAGKDEFVLAKDVRTVQTNPATSSTHPGHPKKTEKKA